MRNFGYVMAPKVLVANKLKVRFMYRETPDNDNDSGWRVFSGEEDQEYVDNPNNIAIYDIETILAIDKDIEKYLSAPVNSAFEREDINQDFVSSAFFNDLDDD
jgi:Uncharacterized protein conserved in bacteria